MNRLRQDVVGKRPSRRLVSLMQYALALAILPALFAIQSHNYLIFHSIIEGFVSLIGLSVFLLAWNARKFFAHDYFVFLGCAYLGVGSLEFIHALAYKGMGVFAYENPANLAANLWLCSRLLEATALLAAPLFLSRNGHAYRYLFTAVTLTAGLLWLALGDYLPLSYVPGEGLTAFKVTAEWVIVGVFLASLLHLYTHRQKLDRRVIKFVSAAVLATVIAEMAFTLYSDVYGMLNVVGHFFTGISFFLVYKAIIEIGLIQPYALFFRELTAQERSLRAAHDDLTREVNVRDAELQATHRLLEREISGRRETELQLQQAQKMEGIGRLAGGLAHDFNNLLTVIVGYSSWLQHEFPEESPVREQLKQIHSAGLKAGAVTKQLLTFSRGTQSERKRLHLSHVVRNMENILRAAIGEKIELDLLLDDKNAFVTANETELEQVVLNLVLNGRDAMSDGGKITIRTDLLDGKDRQAASFCDTAGSGCVRLTVSDTGSGIPQEIIDQIFEPFFSTKPKGAGTGLGLSTVYGIVVRQNNGKIHVTSDPGKGSSFAVYLPLSENALVGETAQSSPPGAVGLEALRPKGRVLIVEDQSAVQQYVVDVLRNHGYRALTAASAEAALEMLAESKVDVDILLTDVILPKLDGSELATRLRAERPDLKIVFMSGYTGDVLADLEAKHPNAMLLEKPLQSSALLSAMERLAVDERN